MCSKTAWAKDVKSAVRAACVGDLNADLSERSFPEAEHELKHRQYLKLAGALGRVGVQHRWSIFQQVYPRMSGEPRHQSMLFGGRSLLEALNGDVLGDRLTEIREQVFRLVGEELSGQTLTSEKPIPEAAIPHIRGAVETLRWPNQSKATTTMLLKFLQRVGQQVSRDVRNSALASVAG